jgi:3-hydroxy-3-methylglutaryl CoA synthase
VGTDTNVESGIVEPQAAGPFNLATLSGPYIFGTENASASTDTLETGVAALDGAGNVVGTMDESSSAGMVQNQNVAIPYTLAADGTGSFGSGTTAILVSGNKLVFINNTSATPTITVVEK